MICVCPFRLEWYLQWNAITLKSRWLICWNYQQPLGVSSPTLPRLVLAFYALLYVLQWWEWVHSLLQQLTIIFLSYVAKQLWQNNATKNCFSGHSTGNVTAIWSVPDYFLCDPLFLSVGMFTVNMFLLIQATRFRFRQDVLGSKKQQWEW